MTAKELFQSNKERVDQLRAVVRARWFEECLLFVRSHILSTPNLTPEHLRGVALFEAALKDIVTDDMPTEELQPGLRHDIDNLSRTSQAQTEAKTGDKPAEVSQPKS